MSANKTVAEQHEIIGNSGNSKKFDFTRTEHPGTKWFYRPVNLGLFIHYGISAVHGDLDISWA